MLYKITRLFWLAAGRPQLGLVRLIVPRMPLSVVNLQQPQQFDSYLVGNLGTSCEPLVYCSVSAYLELTN
jgi:hypothetical protein